VVPTFRRNTLHLQSKSKPGRENDLLCRIVGAGMYRDVTHLLPLLNAVMKPELNNIGNNVKKVKLSV
jgi:hypothetical protein